MSKTGGNEVTNNNDKNNENVNENEGMNKNEGISPEKEAEYRKIFERLDFDSDGRIGVEELKKSLKENGIRGGFPGHAEGIITAGDKDKDGAIDVEDFMQYLHEHELKLRLMFKRFDRNEDGSLCFEELSAALDSVGIHLKEDEVEKILNHLDKDRDCKIDLDEWLEVQLLYPSASFKEMVRFWKHESFLDSGESLLVPDDYNDVKFSETFKRLLSGAMAGAVSRTCTAPLDRLKVMMQVHATNKNRMGIISTFKSILDEGGARSFWRGNGVNVVKIAPETSIKFLAYEKMKGVIREKRNEETCPTHRFLAGACAGAISQTAVYPLEVVKTRLAIRKTGQYTGVFDCIHKLLVNEGPRCFFKGYVPNLVGIIPYAGIDLCVYETFKNQYLKRYGNSKEPGTPLIIFSGCLSTTCGQFASYPFALVRTKMQAQVKKNDAHKLGMFSMLGTIARTEGLFGLYRGLGPNIMKVIPAVSISYVVYEKMRIKLGVYS